jgi:L-threonylcarbamoyladenylate synthase
MSKPKFIIDKKRQSDDRSLPASMIKKVKDKLLGGGFVLLPSDTCYSLGILALNEDARNKVNYVLGRRNEPTSVAFHNHQHVSQWMKMDRPVVALLEQFTPGPITIVCKAKDEIPDEFLERVIGSPDRTIGVRVPNSRIERQIGGCTEHLLMTVAVRDIETEGAVRDFQKACEIVKFGMGELDSVGWGAIEGSGKFYPSHSTVVRVGGIKGVELIRDGNIPFAQIQEFLSNTSERETQREPSRGNAGN